MEGIRQIWCEEDNHYYPEIKIEDGRTYKLDEETFVYLEQLDLGLTDEEQELMETSVDRWGQEWRKFMTENYPEDIPSLQGRLKWELIPRQIDKEAWEMWEMLQKQYAMKNPRPKTFLEIMSWEKMRQLAVEHEVMEQIVLQYRA
ncbi:MAG: hypothetical protein IJE40_06985 [Clostridia bacterium]|nr:hypothetical protein [Clostridia bacterium]